MCVLSRQSGLERCSVRASVWGPGPAKWRSKSNGSSEPEPQRLSAGGRLRAPASPRFALALPRGVHYAGPFLPRASFLTPTPSLRAAGSAGTRGSGWAGEGGADPLAPLLRSGCGNKDPAACPRPRPGPERGPGKGVGTLRLSGTRCSAGARGTWALSP